MLKKEHIAAKIFRSITWHFTGGNKELFLTFDDGPTPEITPWVLSILKNHNAKATFFCLGERVERYPDIYMQILKEGHAVGNHTHTHLRGIRNGIKKYVQDVNRASELIQSNLFRPPYGSIRPKQISQLKESFNIVMWDVLTKDYSNKMEKEKCLKYVMDCSDSGSIVVFHDSIKAQKNLKYVLPKFLSHFSQKGYVFKPIEFA